MNKTTITYIEHIDVVIDPSTVKQTFIQCTNTGVTANSPEQINVTSIAINTGPPGLQGPEGPAGINGLDGERGAQGETGLRGRTGAQGPRGFDGPQGPEGTPGHKWYNGFGPPDEDTPGIDGDYYIDNTSKQYYQKQEGVWVYQGDLGGSGNTFVYVSDTPPDTNEIEIGFAWKDTKTGLLAVWDGFQWTSEALVFEDSFDNVHLTADITWVSADSTEYTADNGA